MKHSCLIYYPRNMTNDIDSDDNDDDDDDDNDDDDDIFCLLFR